MSTALAIPVEYRADSLPALITMAGQRLLDARSSAEVLEAKKMAEFSLHYSKVMKAANETHADCLRVITRAEMRMADEIDAGQARGEVASRRDGTAIRDSDHLASGKEVVRYEDLGVRYDQVSNWRKVRDAGEEAVERAIRAALEEDRAPVKADILRAVKGVRGTKGTGDNEWYTPAEYVERVRRVLGEIDLDPASSESAQETVKAGSYFTQDVDGLGAEWDGRVFLNPPYAQPHVANFVGKLVDEYQAGRVSAAILLTHNYTDTTWFHEAASAASVICFTRGRIRFESLDGRLAAPTQGQAFFYFGDDEPSFRKEFADVGFVALMERE